MYIDALSKFSASTINIPIALLCNQADHVMACIGVGAPAASVGHLAKIGLFNHKSAEAVAKSLFESSGQTFTGRWMDASGPFRHIYPEGVNVGWHRIQGHHFLTDAIKVFKNPELSVVDFYKHLATDVVTKNGLPILPEEMVRGLADTLNVSVNKIMPWVSFNILDIGASVFAVGHAGSNLITILSGEAQWSFGYALDTFGVGAAEIASGFFTENPILVASGAVDVACGSVTAVDYYSQPFFCGMPVEDLLQASSLGICLSSILAAVEIALNKDRYDAKKKLGLLSERISTSGILSALSIISSPLSITTSCGLVGCKLMARSASKTNSYIELLPVTGEFSSMLDSFFVERHAGEETFSNMLQYLEE